MPFDPFSPVPRPLPVPVEPFPEETAASLASRAALIYERDDATTFLKDFGLRFDAVGLGDPDVVRDLAIRLGTDPEGLVNATPNIRTRGSPSFRGHILVAYPAIPLSPRICPVCLAEDRENVDTQEYLRTQWTMPAVGACPKHGVLLEPLPRPPSYRGAKDLHFCLSLWPERRLPAPRPVKTYGIDLAVSDFLATGKDRVGSWSLEEVLATAPLLGCFVEIGPVWPNKIEAQDLQECTEIGFSLLRDGPDALMEAVERRVVQRLAEGLRSLADVVGCLQGTLRHFQKEPTFRPFLHAICTAAVRRLRTYRTQSFLNRVIPPFEDATVETLADRHGIPKASVRFALKADRVPRQGEASAFGKSYPAYDRIAADAAIAKLQATVTHKAAMRFLGMNRPTFEEVWKAGIIQHNPQWPSRKGSLWRHEVEALRDALHAAAPPATTQPEPGWVSLFDFSRRTRLGKVMTARLLLDGALAPACRCPDGHGWTAIRVLESHIPKRRRPLIPPERRNGLLNMQAVSQRYGLRFVTISRLVKMGELPRAAAYKSDGRRKDGYPQDAIDSFFARYRTLRDLAKDHDCSFQMMEPLLDRLGLRPLIDEPGHTKLYAIADLPPAERMAAEVKTATARNARFKKAKPALSAKEQAFGLNYTPSGSRPGQQYVSRQGGSRRRLPVNHIQFYHCAWPKPLKPCDSSVAASHQTTFPYKRIPPREASTAFDCVRQSGKACVQNGRAVSQKGKM
ncbi:MAG: TniQ family protein [Mangrovicoccus sp.]